MIPLPPLSRTWKDRKRLVLLGGGHSHLETIKHFGMHPFTSPTKWLDLIVVTRDVETPYSGMLPGYVSGHYSFEECHIDLAPLVKFAHGTLIHDEVCRIDTKNQTLHFSSARPELYYDVLSINLGSSPHLPFPTAPGLVPVKPISEFARKWRALFLHPLAFAESDRDDGSSGVPGKVRQRHIAVVGGGAASVEMALALRFRAENQNMETAPNLFHGDPDKSPSLLEHVSSSCQKRCKGDASLSSQRPLLFSLVCRGASILPSYPSRTQDAMRRCIESNDINILTNFEVEDVKSAPADGKGTGSRDGVGILRARDGREIIYDGCLWCTNAAAPKWLEETGLALDDQGFIAVDACYRSTSHSNIFAAGDICSCAEFPRPKAGVFAVRAGPPLTANIVSWLEDETRALKPYKPQYSYLSILAQGGKSALASRGSVIQFEGAWVWALKDSIDRAFMKKYSDLPDMKQNDGMRRPDVSRLPLDASHPLTRCCGCGGKVEASILTSAIARLKRTPPSRTPLREDVKILRGIGEDSAVLQLSSDASGVTIASSVDFFKAFTSDSFVVGRIAAAHALSDLYAVGATPFSAEAIVALPHFADPNKNEDELVLLLQGACSIFHEEGVSLVGGHTSESDGDIPLVGFCVKGRIPSPLDGSVPYWKKIGGRPGDSLILTKALGTGALMVAEMQGKMRSRFIIAAMRQMQQSNRSAAEVLRKFNISACTDISGFGFAGHLREMLPNGGDIQAVVDLINIPLLKGAVSAVSQDCVSSLHNPNKRSTLTGVRWEGAEQTDERSKFQTELLFDPQTSGGLLAVVPADCAAQCLEELRKSGDASASIVGYLRKREEKDSAFLVVRVPASTSSSSSASS